MKHLLRILCLVLLLAAALPALAQDGSVESKIIAIEKAWNQAYKFRDAKALSSLLSDTVVITVEDGSVQTKADFLKSVHTSGPSDDQQADPESMSVHVYGSVAIATGVFKQKENGTHIRRVRFIDTWVNQNGSWVCVAASAITVH